MDHFDSWLSPAQRTAIEAFCMSDFKAVKFMTADDKQKVLAHWRKLMTWLSTNGVPADMPKVFSTVIYDHLTLHTSGLIAHYDRPGFWSAELGAPERAMEFVNGLERNVLCRWGALSDYADINTAMMDAAREVRPGILRRLAHDDQQHARAQIAALAARAGISPGARAEDSAYETITRIQVAPPKLHVSAPMAWHAAPQGTQAALF
jgi:hypothetical protein